MLVVLIIIAILLFLILIAIEPEMLGLIGSCLGAVVGLAVIVVGGYILMVEVSDRIAYPQSNDIDTVTASDNLGEYTPIIEELEPELEEEFLGEEVTDPELIKKLNAQVEKDRVLQKLIDAEEKRKAQKDLLAQGEALAAEREAFAAAQDAMRAATAEE